MKYRTIKSPPASSGRITLKDSIKSAKTVVRSAKTGRFVVVKGGKIVGSVLSQSKKASKGKATYASKARSAGKSKTVSKARKAS